MVAGEIQGAYQIKVTTSALALLVSTQNPHLEHISVQGHITKVCAFVVRLLNRTVDSNNSVHSLPCEAFCRDNHSVKRKISSRSVDSDSTSS